ncbi:hypothetical protein ACSGD2_29640, partial [Klebsiella pneumoniae]
MENIALIGIDLGKNSFHIHCQDHRGKAVYRKKFTRPKLIEFLATCPATTIAMEACGGSHFMARKLEELGHFPKLISPQFVRPFVKSNKNGTVAKLAMRQPFVLFKGLTFQKLCLPGAFRPGDHHN